MKGIDTATSLTRELIRQFSTDGITIYGRYLGGDYALTGSEVEDILSAGGHVCSLFESSPTSAAYFQVGRGLTDGSAALAHAKEVGQPEGSGICFTVDYDAQPAEFAAIQRYISEAKQVCGEYHVGLYGKRDLVDAIDADFYIQTSAWSAGGICERACLYQYDENTTQHGVRVDLLEVRATAPVWPFVPTHRSAKPFTVLVNEKPMKALDVDGSTWVMWQGLQLLGTPHQYIGHGIMQAGERVIQGIVFDGDTYLPWELMGQHVAASRTWSFTQA